MYCEWTRSINLNFMSNLSINCLYFAPKKALIFLPFFSPLHSIPPCLKSCQCIDHHNSSALTVFIFRPLPFSRRQRVPPDTGVGSSDGCVRRSRESCFYSEGFPLANRLPYWVTEQTNFVPAENPLVISINTDTRMNAYRGAEWNWRRRETCP